MALPRFFFSNRFTQILILVSCGAIFVLGAGYLFIKGSVPAHGFRLFGPTELAAGRPTAFAVTAYGSRHAEPLALSVEAASLRQGQLQVDGQVEGSTPLEISHFKLPAAALEPGTALVGATIRTFSGEQRGLETEVAVAGASQAVGKRWLRLQEPFVSGDGDAAMQFFPHGGVVLGERENLLLFRAPSYEGRENDLFVSIDEGQPAPVSMDSGGFGAVSVTLSRPSHELHFFNGTEPLLDVRFQIAPVGIMRLSVDDRFVHDGSATIKIESEVSSTSLVCGRWRDGYLESLQTVFLSEGKKELTLQPLAEGLHRFACAERLGRSDSWIGQVFFYAGPSDRPMATVWKAIAGRREAAPDSPLQNEWIFSRLDYPAQGLELLKDSLPEELAAGRAVLVQAKTAIIVAVISVAALLFIYIVMLFLRNRRSLQEAGDENDFDGLGREGILWPVLLMLFLCGVNVGSLVYMLILLF